jgi:hypothetical protein
MAGGGTLAGPRTGPPTGPPSGSRTDGGGTDPPGGNDGLLPTPLPPWPGVIVRPRRAFRFLMSRGLLLGVAMRLALILGRGCLGDRLETALEQVS